MMPSWALGGPFGRRAHLIKALIVNCVQASGIANSVHEPGPNMVARTNQRDESEISFADVQAEQPGAPIGLALGES